MKEPWAVNGLVFQLVNDMEVFLRHLDAGVSHKCLDRLYIGSAVKHVHSETVAGTVESDRLRKEKQTEED